MKKEKEFDFCKFPVSVWRNALKTLFSDDETETFVGITLGVRTDDANWQYDEIEEFSADYRKTSRSASLHHYKSGKELSLSVRGSYMSTPDRRFVWGWQTDVGVRAQSRSEIEQVFALFEDAVPTARHVPPPKKVETPKPLIFVGHGRSSQWRDLKDHLTEQHGYLVKSFESGARAGHTIRDVLEELMTQSTFAVLVLTAEDEQADGQLRARQNVVHEVGLFQGKLGFQKAIMLVEEGCEGFSNVQGVLQIRFSAGNIRETFGDVLATLRRESQG